MAIYDLSKNVTFTKMSISSIYHIYENTKMHKMMKIKMVKKLSLPLRNWTPDFGLRIGSRGTPWNSKSAGPGGSDFTKCQKVPFIWHFGVFGVLSLFHFFWCFAFSVFVIFDDFDFLVFVTFHILSIFWFYAFSDFDQFLSLFSVVMNFGWFLCPF